MLFSTVTLFCLAAPGLGYGATRQGGLLRHSAATLASLHRMMREFARNLLATAPPKWMARHTRHLSMLRDPWRENHTMLIHQKLLATDLFAHDTESGISGWGQVATMLVARILSRTTLVLCLSQMLAESRLRENKEDELQIPRDRTHCSTRVMQAVMGCGPQEHPTCACPLAVCQDRLNNAKIRIWQSLMCVSGGKSM